MKIRRAKANNRRKAFEVTAAKRRLLFPFSRLEVQPTSDDPIAKVFIDQELGAEGFTYVLQSGREGTVHIEDVLEYNRDPDYLRDLLLYRLTLEAQKAVAATPLARREIIRRLGTSPAQLYRLLDQTNYRKSVDQLLRLLQVLDCDVELVVRAKSA
ncbi:MAG: helix-turn-helix domain-containing protein [Candidatus Rokubacteria bacterium]|nr:helix-turn-helix domain-containing protein [Candidatus Rokubacteria bacterium]